MELTIRLNKETLKGLLFGVVLTSIVWAPIYYYLPRTNGQAANQPSNNQPSNNVPTPAAPTKVSFDISANDHLRGKINAPVQLVEFSDFQCPYCSRHHETMKQIAAAYGDKIVWVLKHFPLSFHQYAEKSAEASECASEQGKFWEYSDKLMENQSGLNDTLFGTLAKQLKLDENKFNSCLSSGKYKDKVQADITEAAAKGVEGTPATFVNGELVSGAIPFENFKSIIDQILNTK